MIFRQLFEPLSSTYTYLLGCEETGQAVLIDPVIASMERDLEQVHRLGLTLAFSLDTHIHADHITAALELKHHHGDAVDVEHNIWPPLVAPLSVTSSARAKSFLSGFTQSIKSTVLCTPPATT